MTRQKHSAREHQGFSLLELLIALAMLTILVMIAAQTFPGWMNHARTSEATDSLATSISYARGEAIASGGDVRMCASNNGTACSGTLNEGWLVYHDTDSNDELSTTDKILHWVKQRHKGVSITALTSSGNRVNEFEINHRGYPTINLNISITRNNKNRSIILHRTGRVETQ